MTAFLQSIAKSFEKISSSAKQAEADVSKATQSIAQNQQKAATELDDLIFRLQEMIAMGDKSQQQLLDLLLGVQRGAVEADRAIAAVGDSVIWIDGQFQHLQGVLADILPSTGEVQKRIQETIAGIKSYEEALELLRNLHSAAARDFAKLFAAWQEGKVTLDAVLAAAQRLAAAMPGSEEAQLAQALAEAARKGGL